MGRSVGLAHLCAKLGVMVLKLSWGISKQDNCCVHRTRNDTHEDTANYQTNNETEAAMEVTKHRGMNELECYKQIEKGKREH